MSHGLLAIDIGNTSTYAGFFRDDALAASFRWSTDRAESSDTLALRLTGLLGLYGIARGEVTSIGLCSVVPPLGGRCTEMASRHFGVEALVIGPETVGLPIAYSPPSAVGADRLANVVAAIALVGTPVIVADFGTATTVDVVDGSGTYVGGAIAPGVETGLQSLVSRTAQLPVIDLRPPERAIGGSSAESLRSGLVFGMAATADGLIRRFREELGVAAPAIATGGIAPMIARACAEVARVEPDLTLEGIRIVCERLR